MGEGRVTEVKNRYGNEVLKFIMIEVKQGWLVCCFED